MFNKKITPDRIYTGTACGACDKYNYGDLVGEGKHHQIFSCLHEIVIFWHHILQTLIICAHDNDAEEDESHQRDAQWKMQCQVIKQT